MPTKKTADVTKTPSNLYRQRYQQSVNMMGKPKKAKKAN